MRKGNIDFYKFIFACVIVIYHFNNAADVGVFSRAGYNAVTFFFLVSGYFMTNTAMKKPIAKQGIGVDTLGFIKKKISGVIPEFYIAWIIAFVVSHIVDFNISVCVMDAAKSIFDLLFLRMAGLFCYSPNTVSWYLSAMFIAMAIIWPILRKYTDVYLKLIAPIAFVLMAGIFCHNYENMASWNDWMGIMCSGLFRGIFCIMGGTVCWGISNSLRKMQLSKGQQIMLDTIEIVSLIGVLLIMAVFESGVTDYGILVLSMVLISITTSGQTFTERFFDNKVVYALGEFSLSMFLGHTFWKSLLIYDLHLIETKGYTVVFVIYIVLVIATSLVIMFASKELRNVGKRNKKCEIL